MYATVLVILAARIYSKRLNGYLVSMNMIEQAGFRKGYSTFDHLFVFKSLIDILVKK